MKIVHEWLSEVVDIPADVDLVAREISLRGFEVASVENGVIDFEITANRPDCLSHVGIAREAAVIFAVRSRFLQIGSAQAAGDRKQDLTPMAGTPIGVALEAPDLCPRYATQVFDVTVGPSPPWLTKRLEAAGVRPINNIVDVTNYVMLEMGQPMHAFDLERVAGGRLVVRRARAGETLTTLDGIERSLDPEMLVIADAEGAAAIAGVMGGQRSEIGPMTKRMVLESAYFQPASVRRTSKRLNLKTEASTRFERGGDIEAPVAALARASALLHRIGAAGAPGAISDVYPAPRSPRTIVLRAQRISRVLGMDVPAAEISRILEALGFTVAGPSDPGTLGPSDLRTLGASDLSWNVTVPAFRVDVTREIDLIEEVGRHHGFDKLPVTFPMLDAAQAVPAARIERDRLIRRALSAAGLSESMTFSFIEREAALPFCPVGVEPVAIANPLSETFAVLRPSILPGLIDSCSHNRRRGRKDVRLFETGRRFADGERRAAAFAWCGTASEAHWSGAARAVDFFDAKGIVEGLCSALGVSPLEFTPADIPFLVRGRAASVTRSGVLLGIVGQVSPAIAEQRGFPSAEEMYVAELDVDALSLASTADELRAESLPKYPAIVRDLSILIGEALPAAAVRGTIRSSAPQMLQSIAEFDRYQGKGVPDGRVSLSLRLTFQSADRTLTDDEVESAMTGIVAALQQAHSAERR